MGSPYSGGRDGNVGSGNAFDQEPDVSDSHGGAFRASFQPPTDRLSEEDYRPGEQGGSAPNPRFESVTPDRPSAQSPQRFTYPEPGPGGRNI
jgi:hypothetical protein